MNHQQYLQPVAMHRMHPERLLLTDDASRWFLWPGEAGRAPVEIPERTAWYMSGRPEMRRLGSPRMWFVVADLPVREPVNSENDAFGRGFSA